MGPNWLREGPIEFPIGATIGPIEFPIGVTIGPIIGPLGLIGPQKSDRSDSSESSVHRTGSNLRAVYFSLPL